MKNIFGILISIALLFSTLAITPVTEVKAVGIVPTLGNDNNTAKVFEENGNKYVLWGMDADVWGCQAGDTTTFREHCEALQYVNANTIAIPVCWNMIEPTKNNYSFWYFDIYVNMAKEHGLKATIQWVGINYASGDVIGVPQYVLDDPSTYTKITGPEFRTDSQLLCPSDTDTLNREKEAYYKVLEHLKNFNPSNTVMAMNCGGESDYMRALPENMWNGLPEQDIRCTCSNCNSLYANEGNVKFMEKQFSKYIKAEIDYGKTIYDIPVYSQVCSYGLYPEWRYAENPVVIKSTVNRADHFCAPSVASTSSVNAYIDEMSHFADIPNNYVFTDGIDTGWDANQANIEVAPWINILYYGGLGALYWDNPIDTNIRTDITMREKLRKYWGPLKGIEYQLARNKTSDAKFWWYPDGQTHSWGSLTNFAVDRVSSSSDYGTCFELSPTDICFTGSTYTGAYTFTVTKAGGFNNYKFEKGSFNALTGEWIKRGDVTPAVNGNNAVLTVDSDSGDSSSVVYRFYYSAPQNKMLEYKVVFNSTIPANAPTTLVDVRSLNGYTAFSNIKVNNGDKLHYELYIPSTSNYFYGLGGIDGSTNVTWIMLRNSNPKDQYNNYLYGDEKLLYGADKWISRDIMLSGLPINEGLAHIGPSLITTKDSIASMAGKTAIVYYRNIKVIHPDNTESLIYGNGGFVSDGQMENNLNGTVGTVSLNEVDMIPVEEIGRSLEYKVEFSSTLPINMPATVFDIRSMNDYNAFSNIKVNNGDKLHYELYIPSTSNYFFGLGGIDGSTNISWTTLRNSNPKDQNNNYLYGDEKLLYGADKWISRDITLAGLPLNEGLAHIGPSFVTPKDRITSMAGKTATVYFRNIKVIHADNTESNIYVNGGFISNGYMENNINGIGTVSLTEINNNSDPAVFFKGRKVSNDINRYVTNINPISTISSFRTNIITEGQILLTFKDNQGNQISEQSINAGALVGTGTTVEVNNGIKASSYKTIIYGDLSKDGKIDLDDLVSMRNYICESDQLDEISNKAGDLYGEGNITLNGLVGIMSYVSESGTIRQSR